MSTLNLNGLRYLKRLNLDLVLVVVLIIGGLFALDFALADMERSELHGEAQARYSEGMALLKAGKAADAVLKLERAQSLDRTNNQYQLGLVEALTAAGDYQRAQSLISEVLQRIPNNGPANLLAARLAAKMNARFADVTAHYHRSIYGFWPQDAAAQRIQTRMELIQVLEKRGARSDLMPELLPLESEAANDPKVLKKVAGWFIEAGSPGRAADLYRQLIRENPADASLDEGLGRAELARGDYRAAQVAFLSAFQHLPGRPDIQNEIDLSTRLAALDPTPRRLRSEEKYRRSLRILQIAHDQAESCVAHGLKDQAAASRIEDLLAEYAPDQPDKGHPDMTNEANEQRLARAEQLWDALSACPASTSAEAEELRLIMSKLRQ